MTEHSTNGKMLYTYYIRRYIIAVCLVEFFAFKILDPYYIQFMTTEKGLGLTPTQFGFLYHLPQQ